MSSNLSSANYVSQWVSSVVHTNQQERQPLDDTVLLERIIGPPSVRIDGQQADRQDHMLIRSLSLNENLLKDDYKNFIIVKIPEKVFVDSLDIYQGACDGALVKIEAEKDDNDWMCIWEIKDISTLATNSKPTLLQPTITPTPFKSDSLRLTYFGNYNLIDAIQVKGSKKIVLKNMTSVDYDETNAYGDLSRNLYKLVTDDLFADVYFEVEGKRIAAHRNILTCRSQYFHSMLGHNANFREATQQNPIYLKNTKYDVFIQVLNFLYTGHIQVNNDPSLAVDLILYADLFGINRLEDLVLYHLDMRITEKNCIKVFSEACEKLPEQPRARVLEICYDIICKSFDSIIETAEFCSLPQTLMVKVIEDVVPKLPAKTPSVAQQPQQQQPEYLSESDEIDSDDSDD